MCLEKCYSVSKILSPIFKEIFVVSSHVKISRKASQLAFVDKLKMKRFYFNAAYCVHPRIAGRAVPCGRSINVCDLCVSQSATAMWQNLLIYASEFWFMVLNQSVDEVKNQSVLIFKRKRRAMRWSNIALYVFNVDMFIFVCSFTVNVNAPQGTPRTHRTSMHACTLIISTAVPRCTLNQTFNYGIGRWPNLT